jgi:RHH-type proline utilization regulon transcriptional repressor/proline dehydrogenase/delta 1-pyrroline-5-carboxylate dehydrogenase
MSASRERAVIENVRKGLPAFHERNVWICNSARHPALPAHLWEDAARPLADAAEEASLADSDLSELRHRVRLATHEDEERAVAQLIDQATTGFDAEARERITAHARAWVRTARERSDRAGTLDAFLTQFGLSNREGVALMCLAEALLRVPDDATADRLISEKIRAGNWVAHRGKSRSAFVNASVWGLMLTGRLVTLDPATLADTDAWMKRLVSRVGEPVVRTAELQAKRNIGGP